MPDDRLDAPRDGRPRAAAPAVGQSRPAGRVKARVHVPDAVLEQHPEAVGHLLEMLVGRWGLGVVEVESGVARRQPVQDGQVTCTVRVAGYRVPVVLELQDVRLGSGNGSVRL